MTSYNLPTAVYGKNVASSSRIAQQYKWLYQSPLFPDSCRQEIDKYIQRFQWTGRMIRSEPVYLWLTIPELDNGAWLIAFFDVGKDDQGRENTLRVEVAWASADVLNTSPQLRDSFLHLAKNHLKLLAEDDASICNLQPIEKTHTDNILSDNIPLNATFLVFSENQSFSLGESEQYWKFDGMQWHAPQSESSKESLKKSKSTASAPQKAIPNVAKQRLTSSGFSRSNKDKIRITLPQIGVLVCLAILSSALLHIYFSTQKRSDELIERITVNEEAFKTLKKEINELKTEELLRLEESLNKSGQSITELQTQITSIVERIDNLESVFSKGRKHIVAPNTLDDEDSTIETGKPYTSDGEEIQKEDALIEGIAEEQSIKPHFSKQLTNQSEHWSSIITGCSPKN